MTSYSLLIILSQLNQKIAIYVLRNSNSHIPDMGDFTIIDLNQLKKIIEKQIFNTYLSEQQIKTQSQKETRVEKRNVYTPQKKLNNDYKLEAEHSLPNTDNICDKNVSQSVTEMMKCAANNIDDIRLPAMRNIRFKDISLQLFNGWIQGVWNFGRYSINFF